MARRAQPTGTRTELARRRRRGWNAAAFACAAVASDGVQLDASLQVWGEGGADRRSTELLGELQRQNARTALEWQWRAEDAGAPHCQFVARRYPKQLFGPLPLCRCACAECFAEGGMNACNAGGSSAFSAAAASYHPRVRLRRGSA